MRLAEADEARALLGALKLPTVKSYDGPRGYVVRIDIDGGQTFDRLPAVRRYVQERRRPDRRRRVKKGATT